MLIVTHDADDLGQIVDARYAAHAHVRVISSEKLPDDCSEPCIHISVRSSAFPKQRDHLDPAQHAFVVLEENPEASNRFTCTVLSCGDQDGLDSLATLWLQNEHNDRKHQALLSRVDEFVSVAHHDLSESHRTIAFFSEFVAGDDDGLSEKTRELLQRVTVAGQRSQLLLKDLTRYARVWLRSYEPAEQSPEEVRAIGDMAFDRAISRVGSSGCRLEWVGAVTLHCSERYLSTIFEELLANAVEFHTDPDTAIQVHFSSSERPGLVNLSVVDDGPGIRDPGSGRLFRPFYRGKRDDELRSGIGLAMVRAMIERAGGAIWLEQREGGSSSDILCSLPGAMIPSTEKG